MSRAVLFDVDGTLVDSNYLHAVCWAEALRQHGRVVQTARVHRGIGMATDELLTHLLGEYEALRGGWRKLFAAPAASVNSLAIPSRKGLSVCMGLPP